jgi:hypothetical protein
MGIGLAVIYIVASVVVVIFAFVSLIKENKKTYR